ncbi:hypothetical protein [Streptomyces niveus]|uniref:hypothetical protein n=1 Tax=Streptomyces niveus TaxID=193462 RepID=UPI003426AE74
MMRTAARTPYSGGARTVGCLSLLVLPFLLAHRLLRPSRPGRVTDPGIEGAQWARTLIGAAATLWLIGSYPTSTADIVQDKTLELFLSAGILLVAGPATLGVFVLSTRFPLRRIYFRRLEGPVTGVAAFIGSAIALWFLAVGGMVQLAAVFAGLPLAGLLISVAGMLFGIPFLVSATVLGVHYTFRVGDVSEVLPPLLSPVLVWALFLFQIGDASPVVAPLGVRAVFALGPAVSVTLLSLWELRRLNVRYGITVRRALGRSPIGV